MKLKQILLTFENCETVAVPAAMVPYVCVEGITTTQIYAGDGAAESFLECSTCEIHLASAAGEIEMEELRDTPYACNLRKRLDYRDIAQVDLVFRDHTDSYLVRWPDGVEGENPNMQVADEINTIRITIG